MILGEPSQNRFPNTTLLQQASVIPRQISMELDFPEATVTYPIVGSQQEYQLDTLTKILRVYIKTAKDHWTRFMTPHSLRSEIIAVDRGGAFAPGEYVLSIPDKGRKLGKGTGTETGRRNRPSKTKRRPYHRATNVRTGPA